MKILFCLLLGSLSLAANPFLDYVPDQKIGVQNSILTKVNGKTISMMDVKKKMDLAFYQHYPQFSESVQARFQFYETSWRQVLRDMIDHELIISDATDKEIKLSDGDVRESLEERFGPNVMQTLDQIGLTYDEAWKMVKNELIVQRMNWWFVQSKALSDVTPNQIRQAYKTYLKENPPYTEWKYRVITIQSEDKDSQLPDQVYDALAQSGKTLAEIETVLGRFQNGDAKISLSSEFVAKTQDLSEAHKKSLEGLMAQNFSRPALQKSKGRQQGAYRIFYLIDRTDTPAPSFDTIAGQLKNGLIQQAIVDTSDAYLKKLRKFYGYENNQAIPDDLHPFSLQ